MIFEYKEPDIDLLIKCLIENGCTVRKAKDGEGGIYLRGKKLTNEELMDCIMHPWEDDEIMSILIKGIEMPKERESFTLTIKYNGLVFDTETGIQVAEAQEIPPHGRLIDADALMNKINSARLLQPEIEDVYMDDYIIVGDWLRSAPTIIPAEERE